MTMTMSAEMLFFIMLAKCSFILFFLSPIAQISCEHFSAISQLKRLPEVELSAIERIDQLLVDKHGQSHPYRDYYDAARSVAKAGAELPEEHSANPVDGYHRIKRLARLRQELEWIDEKKEHDTEKQALPDENDLEGAVEALIRLAMTYQLPMEDLTEGIITSNTMHNPDQTGSELIFKADPLNANDCYRIAKHANETLNLPIEAILWAEQAVRLIEEGHIDIVELYDDEEDHKTPYEYLETDFKGAVYKFLAQMLKRQGFNAEAAKVINKAWQLILPTSEMSVIDRLKKDYESAARESPGRKRSKGLGFHSGVSLSNYSYEALCRGEKELPESNYSKLSCFYLDSSTISDPYFRLWKIKVEEAGKHPHIVQYHDVITEQEIDFLIAHGNAKMERARVGVHKDSTKSNNRVSQIAWGWDTTAPLFAKLTRRIQAFTGLNVENGGEALQICNYGLGGFYAPHFDHKEDGTPEADIFPSTKMRNRIATWMFYLSDVTLGGATVFTNAGVTIWPRKGSAAFWYNLRSSGNGDPLAKHAGCPVLIGSKWVANKWIHEFHQEFIRPCSLKPYEFLVLEKGHH